MIVHPLRPAPATLMSAIFLSAAALALVPSPAPARAEAKAADGKAGEIRANQVKAGVDAWTQGDYAAAVAAWQEPAEQGDADAQYNMGQAYRLGRGVPANLETALDWFRKAAAARGQTVHLKAADNVGLVLFQLGRRQDAMPFIQASADRGEPRAQYILGISLFNGELVAKDWPRAHALLSRAAASGIAAATQGLKQMEPHLSAEQRTQAVALAADMEKREKEAKQKALASLPPVTIPPASIAAGPPAEAAEERPAKPVRPAPAPAPVPMFQTAMTDIPGYVPSVGQKEHSAAPAAAPATVSPAEPKAAPATGPWRVQLGALDDEGRARSYGEMLAKKIPALASQQYFYDMSAAPLVRLQAGAFATKAEADKMCAAVKAKGHDCFARRK